MADTVRVSGRRVRKAKLMKVLTNYLPAQRQKNKFDVEHIRAANPNIIYARGSAYGD
jgi:crotonobetainyl-CoA:carnitine CoA-transferase CaiB-like acyl-CoA transferase